MALLVARARTARPAAPTSACGAVSIAPCNHAGMDWHPIERRALAAALTDVGPRAPTLCEGWGTEHLAAHVILRESTALVAAGVAVPALHDRTERMIRSLGDRSVATGDWADLVRRVEDGPHWWHPLQLVGDPAQLVELHVHTEDVRRAGPHGRLVRARPLLRGHEDALWRGLVKVSRMAYGRFGLRVTLIGERPGQRHDVGPPGKEVEVSGGVSELILHGFGRGRAARVTVDGEPDAVAALDGRLPR